MSSLSSASAHEHATIALTLRDADITDALGDRIHYTLDPLGHRTREEVQDPAGKLSLQVNRQYDALNRLQQVSGGAQ